MSKMHAGISCWVGLVCLAVLIDSCESHTGKQRVVVFHAASLSRVLGEVKDELGHASPGLDVILEPSGSLMAARKISELGRHADLLVTADWRVIRDLMIPQKADWIIQFVSNELVLAHTEFSPYTQEITPDNWPSILLRPDVRLGRASEQTAPVGYQTLQLWALAANSPGLKGASKTLAESLDAKCKAGHVTPDVSELVTLLESHTIDYAFLFRSIAEEHHLKVTRLADDYNLGNPAKADLYAKAVVPLSLHGKGPVVRMKGAPVIYGLTIALDAANPKGAEQVVEFILGPNGRKLFSASGYTIIDPPTAPFAKAMPASLSRYIRVKK